MDFKLGCESAKYSEGFGELLKERGTRVRAELQ